MNTPVLCYIKGPWAYFTTQPLDKQWGDDWNDAPYEHNAGEPYEPCWHNLPHNRNNPNRGWKPGTQTPLDAWELCQCSCCVRDWNTDGTPKWEIIKVGWEGNLSTPADLGFTNSPWSVEQINAGAVAWLTPCSYSKPTHQVIIPAGTSLDEFTRLVKLAGGNVYRKLE